jgi:single-strand DNA-binding protein
MYARIILAGRIVKKPAIKRTEDKVFASMTIAVNANGSQEADFFDLVAYDKNAELAEKYIDKGKPILVEGQPKIGKWEKGGEKHSRFEVHVSRITFLPDKSHSQDFSPEGDDDTPL